MRHVLWQFWRAVRGWPIHRWAALSLLPGIVVPGSATVWFGDFWRAGPAMLYVLLAVAQILPLWWLDRRPVLVLTATGVSCLFTQAFAWPSTTADLSIFVALATVGSRVRPRTALACAAAVAVALDIYMTAAQAPQQLPAVGQALFPAAVIAAMPTLIGMSYRRVRHGQGSHTAPDLPTGPRSSPPAQTATGQPGAHRMGLTARELAILAMVAEGLTNAEIADGLTIGRETVKTHVGNILAKLGARDRTHAVTIAYRNRLIEDR